LKYPFVTIEREWAAEEGLGRFLVTIDGSLSSARESPVRVMNLR